MRGSIDFPGAWLGYMLKRQAFVLCRPDNRRSDISESGLDNGRAQQQLLLLLWRARGVEENRETWELLFYSTCTHRTLIHLYTSIKEYLSDNIRRKSLAVITNPSLGPFKNSENLLPHSRRPLEGSLYYNILEPRANSLGRLAPA